TSLMTPKITAGGGICKKIEAPGQEKWQPSDGNRRGVRACWWSARPGAGFPRPGPRTSPGRAGAGCGQGAPGQDRPAGPGPRPAGLGGGRAGSLSAPQEVADPVVVAGRGVVAVDDRRPVGAGHRPGRDVDPAALALARAPAGTRSAAVGLVEPDEGVLQGEVRRPERGRAIDEDAAALAA